VPPAIPGTPPRLGRRLALVFLAALLVWACWPTLVELAHRFWYDPHYNHGFLVPVFAAVLLWLRRGSMPAALAAPSWWGLPLLAVGAALRLAGGYYFFPWAEAFALLPLVAGLVTLYGGLPALRWAWPAVAFLFFMVPLPHRAHVALAPALQELATEASTYCLQTLGYCAVADGTTIRMNELKISVIQACSGLSMLITFFALATGLVLVTRRPLRDKVAILLSAAPVALVANVARITATGVLHKSVGGAVARAVFHDLAGWLMMPLALVLLGLELKLLSKLVMEEAAPAPLTIGVAARAARRDPPHPVSLTSAARREAGPV
jgi:exosortase